MLNYFNWIEISSLDQNSSFLNLILTWEDTTSTLSTDTITPFLIFFSTYSKIFLSLSFSTYSSFLDFILNVHYSSYGTFFLNFFYLDVYTELTSTNTLYNYILFNEGGDLLLNFLTYNKEILFIYNNYYNTLITYSTESVSSFYDSFLYTQSNGVLDFCLFNLWLALTLVFAVMFTNILIFAKLGTSITNNFFLNKFFLFANNFAFENRLQLDWTLTFLLFIIIIWVPVLITYDDVNVEIIELLHTSICVYFILIIFYLLYKYSLHYFAFLENSVSEDYTTQYVSKQFVRDISNTFALFLRFFLLLFRLNIYDGLDDFLDSYYIFFIDFDEDSYLDELFFLSDFFSYFTDNREDVVFYQPVEFDWWLDLYSKYFVIFGKFFFFWAFILEEAFRISLALYISYLIIFEVHAVNVSNNEDITFSQKKTISNY